MIKERTPLTMNGAKEILADLKENDKNKDIQAFIKKFSKLDEKSSKKLKIELETLNILKLRSTDIVKIVDICPENAVELNKIFTEISLDADETSKILDAIKNNQ